MFVGSSPDECTEGMTVAPGGEAKQPLGARSTVLVFVTGDPARFTATLLDLLDRSDRPVVVAGPAGLQLQGVGGSSTDALETIEAASAAEAVAAVAARGSDVFVVTDPVVLPDDAIARAEQIVASDLRVSSVSFFSNDSGPHSFPDHTPGPSMPAGHDAQSLTDRLRSVSPVVAPTAIPYAAGGAVMLSAVGLSLVGAPVPVPGDPGFDASLADFSLRGRERGLLDLLDPATYVYRSPAARGGGRPPSVDRRRVGVAQRATPPTDGGVPGRHR